MALIGREMLLIIVYKIERNSSKSPEVAITMIPTLTQKENHSTVYRMNIDIQSLYKINEKKISHTLERLCIIGKYVSFQDARLVHHI